MNFLLFLLPSAVQAGKFLVDEQELVQMRNTVEALHSGNIEKEALIHELESRMQSVIRMNEALAYKLTQFQSLDFDRCVTLNNEELVEKIFDYQKKRSFFSRPPTWLVYATSASIVPIMILTRALLTSFSKFRKCLSLCSYLTLACFSGHMSGASYYISKRNTQH